MAGKKTLHFLYVFLIVFFGTWLGVLCKQMVWYQILHHKTIVYSIDIFHHNTIDRHHPWLWSWFESMIFAIIYIWWILKSNEMGLYMCRNVTLARQLVWLFVFWLCVINVHCCCNCNSKCGSTALMYTQLKRQFPSHWNKQNNNWIIDTNNKIDEIVILGYKSGQHHCIAIWYNDDPKDYMIKNVHVTV